MPPTIDLNCDMGESYGAYTIGADAAVMPYITSANIACGFHAGDPLVMQRTVRLAVENGVAVGAHPGYPDLQGFGRRNMEMTLEEVEAMLLYQIGALAAVVRGNGGDLVHVKPHGALYNQAAADRRLAEAVARAVARYNNSLILVGMAGSRLIEAAQEAGLTVAQEAFPDRAYDPDGSLRSRKLPGAVIEDPSAVCTHALQLVRDGILGPANTPIPVDTLCIHGDNPGAARIAAALREALAASGVEVRPLRRPI